MKYIEVCKSLKDRGNIKPTGNIAPIARNHEFYISLFPFDETIIKHVKATGGIKGHKGKHYCDYILIDVDSEDLGKAKEDAVQVINVLSSEFGLSPYDLFIWFSGNKGFHIAIVDKIYGKLNPDENISDMVKSFVRKFFSHIPSVDLAIYENHRIIRVENSLNEKSGLYKIQLNYDELASMSCEDIKEIANAPREIERQVHYNKLKQNDKLLRALKGFFHFTEVQINEDGFFTPAIQGDRNNKLYKQAAMLFKTSDLAEKSVNELITCINIASKNPLPQSEIDSLVRSAARGGKREKEQDLTFSTINSLISDWINDANKKSKKISLLFPELNKEFSGKLNGKLCAFIGYGGSKKSLIAQNIAFDNVRKKKRVLYSSMEMGYEELLTRFLNMQYEGKRDLASDDIEQWIKDKTDISGIINEVNDVFSDHLLCTFNSSMTADKYQKMIDETKPDVLIVDGLSMMGGKGTELELANKHSKELKDLARDNDIFIIFIVHASRGEHLETRDLTRKARASEKIMDNSDFAVTMSFVSGVENIGVYHCWNKRGSGRHIEKAFEIVERTLLIKETEYDYEQAKF